MLNTSHSTIFAALGFAAIDALAAVTVPDMQSVQQQEPLIQEEQRQQQFQKKMQPSVDVHLDGAIDHAESNKLPQNETPCYAIKDITLVGDNADQFQFALHQAIKQSAFKPAMCLGSQGINYIMTLVQNAVIEKGYITTRIFAAPQDLKEGHLIFTVFPGRIHEIRYDMDNRENTHVDRISGIPNKFPASSGDILNLRELEQGLENLKRIPTAETDIQIVPSDIPNESDVVVTWSYSRLVRFSLSADDSGSHSTGKYQGGMTLSLDNMMGLSDLFYASFNQNLGSKNKLTDADGSAVKNGTNSYAIHYSVPFGNWLLAINHNYYRYHQAVAGLNENYDYNGDSFNTNFGVTRLLYRDAHRKTYFTLKSWQRESHNYINDAEIAIQHRRTAGWSAELEHKEYISNATLNLKLGYKRGTGASQSIRAPEEMMGYGTSRMQLITTDVDLSLPFTLGKQFLSYESNLHMQWNRTALVPQDNLAIGGRYSVRGFDGEMTLMGERGGYLHNDLIWQYWSGHQLYLGLDVGHVVARSTEPFLGHTLVGSVLGVKGQIMLGGQLYYDLFVGTPLYKPANFKTSHVTTGFNLNYAF